MKEQATRMIDAQHIEHQATRIRDIAQAIIDACQKGERITPLARNKVAGGSLAQDAAVLGIQIVQYEMENK